MQPLRLTNLFSTLLPAVYLRQFEGGKEHHLYAWGLETTLPRFELFIHDSNNKSLLNRPGLCVFVVPVSQEAQWSFSALEGRERLAVALKAARLILVKLGHGQNFRSSQEVQRELALTVKELRPESFQGRVSFYCDEHPANRKTLAITSDVIVEETQESGGGFRSLTLSNCLTQPQSEARVTSRGECDYSDLKGETMKLMAAGLALMLPQTPAAVVILGGVAGVLAQFLVRQFAYMTVSSVEKHDYVLRLSEEYFDLKSSDRLHVVHMDASDYITDLHQSSQFVSAVVLNLNSDSVKSAVPPTAFRSFWFLLQVKETLACPAVLVINSVHRCANHRIELVNVLKDLFGVIYCAKGESEEQEVFFAVKVEGKYIPKVNSQWRQRMKAIETEQQWNPRLKLYQSADKINLEFPVIEDCEVTLEAESRKKVRKPPTSKRSGL